MNDRRSNEGNTAQFSQACHEDGHDPMVDNVRTWKRYFRCRYCGHALDSDEERRQAAEALGLPEEITVDEMKDKPWSLQDVVAKLVEAADHLVNEHGCDQHGHEEVAAARDAAKLWLAARHVLEGKITETDLQTMMAAHRERLCQAFLAETGLLPSECELVFQTRIDSRQVNLVVNYMQRRNPQPWGLVVHCCRCEKMLHQPGALILGQTDAQGLRPKKHVCAACWEAGDYRAATHAPVLGEIVFGPPDQFGRVQEYSA